VVSRVSLASALELHGGSRAPARSRVSLACQFSIARGIVELLGDSPGARVMGKRAGNAASRQYSWPAVGRHDDCSLRHNRENLSRYSIGGNAYLPLILGRVIRRLKAIFQHNARCR
jgi:hypothetical protein